MDGFTALYIFALAAFTGYEVISRVPVILHTPLMSGSNFRIEWQFRTEWIMIQARKRGRTNPKKESLWQKQVRRKRR